MLIDETCKFRIFSAHSDYTGSDDPVDITQDNAFSLALDGNESTPNVVYQVSFNNGEWNTTNAAQSALAEARTAQDTLQRERERLAWQIGELDKLAPLEGEWEELNTQHGRLSNAQALIDAAQQANALLEGDEQAGALALLARARSNQRQVTFWPFCERPWEPLAALDVARHRAGVVVARRER